MTREEATKVLGDLIPLIARGGGESTQRLMIKLALLKAIEALQAEPSKDSPANVFVMRANIFASDGIIKDLREEIADQIRSGVVVLPSYMELVAVTGPCTDVEVRIITEEEHDG